MRQTYNMDVNMDNINIYGIYGRVKIFGNESSYLKTN